MVICLERGADLHMAQLMPLTVSCFSKIQTGFFFLVPAHPGSPGKRAVKRVYVCMYYYTTGSQKIITTRCNVMLLLWQESGQLANNPGIKQSNITVA